MTIKQIAVLGMPNTGKSTFFNRFTGANASIGNWPGITVVYALGTPMQELLGNILSR